MWRSRPAISGLLLVVFVNLWLLSAYNFSFWSRSYGLLKSQPSLFLLFVVGIWGLSMAYILLFTNRWLLKPVLIANILIAAGASYFHENMGVVIDREMIQNILGTTANESKNLFTLSYIRYMVAFAVIPSLVVLLVRVSHPPFLKSALRHNLLLLVCGLLFFGVAYSNYQTYSFSLKKSPGLRKILHPAGPVNSAIQYAQMMWRAQSLEFQQIGLDARKGELVAHAKHPVLTLLVIGETLRDQNWGLSGYKRNTTPELAKLNVLSFAGVETCGTSTSVSIPCMFSKYNRSDFTFEKAVATENLLDLLVRAGYDVEWWDANTGDMGVAKRVPYSNYNRANDPEFCSNGECNDGILLKLLQQKAETITHDTVIVMHQIGNHGPAYFERYPTEFAKFLPDCRDADLANCPPGEVVNAYDNAVAYTDLQLANTIKYLETLSNLSTSLIYVSDHGESLGENNLYLHAAPYWAAPEEQTRVPMLLWMSDNFRSDMTLDYNCVENSEDKTVTHDNFFHSVLGMLNIETTERTGNLDLFAPCRVLQSRQAMASN